MGGVPARERQREIDIEREKHIETRESSYSAGNRLDAAVQPKYEAKAQHQKDIARLMVCARDRMGVGMGMWGWLCAIY